jgi:hypothetical protein
MYSLRSSDLVMFARSHSSSNTTPIFGSTPNLISRFGLSDILRIDSARGTIEARFRYKRRNTSGRRCSQGFINSLSYEVAPVNHEYRS